MSADNGYMSGDNLQTLEDSSIDAYIATHKSDIATHKSDKKNKVVRPEFGKTALRSEDLIISECLAQDFCSSSSRGNRRIAGYATVSTTQMTDKKTSQEPDIIKSSLLSPAIV